LKGCLKKFAIFAVATLLLGVIYVPEQESLLLGIGSQSYSIVSNALAEEQGLENESSESLDAVLLLDASGSMRRTDPQRLRDQGAKQLTQFLKTGDRLAIVEFSDQASIIRELSDYASSQAESVAQDIQKAGNSGLYTDLSAGIQKALEQLSASPRAGVTRSIILLSDGQMDPNPDIASVAERTTLLEQLLGELKDANINVHTLALSELSDRKLLSRIATETEGLGWYAPTADTIQQSFAELFLAVKKPQVLTISSRGFLIDEGIDEATFYINRTTDDDLILISPTGREIRAQGEKEDVDWFVGKKFDVVTIRKPEVGNWSVSGLPSSDSFATVLTNLKLITDWPTSAINVGDKVRLAARFYESKKPVALPQLSGVIEYIYEIIPIDKVDGIFSALIEWPKQVNTA